VRVAILAEVRPKSANIRDKFLQKRSICAIVSENSLLKPDLGKIQSGISYHSFCPSASNSVN
jgi:hypothetical protein